MIVQIQKSKNSLPPSVHLVAETADDQIALGVLVEILKTTPVLRRESHTWTISGVDNVLLTASKRTPSGRS